MGMNINDYKKRFKSEYDYGNGKLEPWEKRKLEREKEYEELCRRSEKMDAPMGLKDNDGW